MFCNHDTFFFHIVTTDRNKLAGFDFDHTIVKPKKNIHPKNVDDWEYVFPNVKNKLKDLWDDGYCITIFSNQRALEAEPRKNMILQRMENISKDIGIPINFILSSKNDKYRKPNTGMYEVMESMMEIDKYTSFYVGDAAGRIFNTKRKKDFSSSDRYFASNIDIEFFNPEQFFNQPCDEYCHIDNIAFNQLRLLKLCHQFNGFTTLSIDIPEMVIIVGYPSCGKTSFINRYFSTYQINPKLYSNDKIIIDGTNHTKQIREKFINIAKKHKLKVRCFYLNIDLEISKHLNNFRMLTEDITKYKDVVFNTCRKYFELPELSEGFENIININFVPILDSKEHEELFYKYS